MNKNMGSTDKIIRIIIALGLAALYFTNIISGTIAIIAIVVAVIFVLTSVVSICPLYSIFGINTCKVPQK
ncbi:Protein of unknown function [Lutibacter oricola]|uniref:Inner membrane protein YgaP-like transmembrane domain-containing protein n=1 Tax=Lutibacter oricola TaxID=762486 RepID=A0A1H3F5T5_9FLAO|nr:DUF2892 domain-containing protein [Lutibacter oricola]SDX85534.1 Protein of unknown function [Lutibacter oricola]